MNAEVTRRTFLKVVGGIGAGLVLGCYPEASPVGPTAQRTPKKPLSPDAYLQVSPDGSVLIMVSKQDMGQGVRTTFAMLVAEELDADWSKVQVQQAPANPGLYGGQGTGGSTSTRTTHRRLRQAGATARAMLVAAAAQRWKVDPSECRTENGRVFHTASRRSASYGELAEAAASLPVPEGVPMKDRKDYRLVGQRKVRLDNRDVVTGKAMFGQDVVVPGALYAVVSRRPAIGASLRSFDDAAARKVPGVVDVVRIGSGVAVVGTNTWAAIQGRDALVTDWDLGPNAALDSANIRGELVSVVLPHPEQPAGEKSIEATYDLPYLAHATMEPMNAVADVREGEARIWAPTQAPDGGQRAVAQTLNIPVEKVVFQPTLVGGGFGRRFSSEFVIEAVEVSRAVKRPVKLLWTRDDDMRNDTYRPMSHHVLRGTVGGGKAVAWSHQAILAQGRGGDRFTRADLPYAIEAAVFRRGGAGGQIPTGAWRSVEHSQTEVVNECFIDEMAYAAGRDPYQFRREMIRDARLRAVLDKAAEEAKWGSPLPAGHGRGIACFIGYGSCAAHVVEASVEAGMPGSFVGRPKVRIHRVVCAVDCGLAINPLGVEAQMHGAFVDGMSTALKAAITIDKGLAEQTSYVDYEWTRMPEMPKIEVHIIDSGAEFGGMGEVGYPSAPAAVANAIFAATGKRYRSFPIRLSEEA